MLVGSHSGVKFPNARKLIHDIRLVTSVLHRISISIALYAVVIHSIKVSIPGNSITLQSDNLTNLTPRYEKRILWESYARKHKTTSYFGQQNVGLQLNALLLKNKNKKIKIPLH